MTNKRIGGSSIAAIMGLSTYNTPLDIYYKLTDESKFKGNEHTRFGNKIEPLIIAEFEERFKTTIIRRQEEFVHTIYDYMVVYVDGINKDGDYLLSAKNTSKDIDRENFPIEFICQSNFEMGLTGIHESYIAYLSKGWDSNQVRYVFDDELFSEQIKAAKHFWETYILTGTPPPPSVPGDILKYISASAIIKTADGNIEGKIKSLQSVKAQIKNLEFDESVLTDEIKMFMVEADTLTTSDGAVLCTWKNNKPSLKVDLKELENSYPDIVAQFKTEQPGARVLRLKEAKYK